MSEYTDRHTYTNRTEAENEKRETEKLEEIETKF
jgi:hypothetical protein